MDHENPGRRQFLAGSLALGTASLLPARAVADGTPAAAAPAPAAPAAAGSGRLTFHAIDTPHGSTIGSQRVEQRRQQGEQADHEEDFEKREALSPHAPLIVLLAVHD